MKLWKVTCSHPWDAEDEISIYSFGSYDGALIWVLQNGKDLDWAAIEENEYVPCDEENPGGRLYIKGGHFEHHDKNEIMMMKKVYDNLCKPSPIF